MIDIIGRKIRVGDLVFNDSSFELVVWVPSDPKDIDNYIKTKYISSSCLIPALEGFYFSERLEEERESNEDVEMYDIFSKEQIENDKQLDACSNNSSVDQESLICNHLWAYTDIRLDLQGLAKLAKELNIAINTDTPDPVPDRKQDYYEPDYTENDECNTEDINIIKMFQED